MDITSISNFYRSQQLVQAGTSAQTDPVQKAFTKASERLKQQAQATEAQISAYGQVKSGLSRVEDAGKSLATINATSSPTEIKKNVQTLVSAYNETRAAAVNTGPGNAQTAVNSLRNQLSSDTGRADLRALGISQQQDGSLKLDSAALDAALRATPESTRAAAARIGKVAEQSADQSLSATGQFNTALNTLNARAESLQSRQSEQQKLFENSQQAVQQTTSRFNGSLSGIESYLRIFSL